MRYLILLLLISCGLPPVHSYSFADDVPQQDKFWTQDAMDFVNEALGCRAVWIDDQEANNKIIFTMTPQEKQLLPSFASGEFKGNGKIDQIITQDYTQYDGRVLDGGIMTVRDIMHEIGHGLGMEDHSPTPGDIMYWQAGDADLTPETLQRYAEQIRAANPFGSPCAGN